MHSNYLQPELDLGDALRADMGQARCNRQAMIPLIGAKSFSVIIKLVSAALGGNPGSSLAAPYVRCPPAANISGV